MAFQFADTLGTTLFCSSNKDGFQPSRMVLSAEEEKAVVPVPIAHCTHSCELVLEWGRVSCVL